MEPLHVLPVRPYVTQAQLRRLMVLEIEFHLALKKVAQDIQAGASIEDGLLTVGALSEPRKYAVVGVGKKQKRKRRLPPAISIESWRNN